MLDSKTAWWMSKGLHCLSGQMGWGTWSWVWSLVKGFGPATLSGVQPSSPGWGGEGLRAPGRRPVLLGRWTAVRTGAQSCWSRQAVSLGQIV